MIQTISNFQWCTCNCCDNLFENCEIGPQETKWLMNTDRQLGYGRETARVANFKGISDFEVTF